MTVDLYDPLTFENLMAGLARHFESISKQSLARFPDHKIKGPGIYSLYYSGTHAAYEDIADGNAPIYVGKAVPPGNRKGGKVDVELPAIRNRLNTHCSSIDSVHNLSIGDFTYRALAVVPVWITLSERFLIENYNPVWNVCLDGFGKHNPGKRRATGERSWWDTLHPGRDWAETERSGGKTMEAAERKVREFLGNAT